MVYLHIYVMYYFTYIYINVKYSATFGRCCCAPLALRSPVKPGLNARSGTTEAAICIPSRIQTELTLQKATGFIHGNC